MYSVDLPIRTGKRRAQSRPATGRVDRRDAYRMQDRSRVLEAFRVPACLMAAIVSWCSPGESAMSLAQSSVQRRPLAGLDASTRLSRRAGGPAHTAWRAFHPTSFRRRGHGRAQRLSHTCASSTKRSKVHSDRSLGRSDLRTRAGREHDAPAARESLQLFEVVVGNPGPPWRQRAARRHRRQCSGTRLAATDIDVTSLYVAGL